MSEHHADSVLRMIIFVYMVFIYAIHTWFYQVYRLFLMVLPMIAETILPPRVVAWKFYALTESWFIRLTLSLPEMSILTYTALPPIRSYDYPPYRAILAKKNDNLQNVIFPLLNLKIKYLMYKREIICGKKPLFLWNLNVLSHDKNTHIGPFWP